MENSRIRKAIRSYMDSITYNDSPLIEDEDYVIETNSRVGPDVTIFDEDLLELMSSEFDEEIIIDPPYKFTYVVHDGFRIKIGTLLK